MLTTYLSTLLEFLCIYYVVKKLNGDALIPDKNDIISFLIILLCLGNIPTDAPILSWLLGQVLYFCYITFAYKKERILHNVLLFSASLIYTVIIQVFCSGIIALAPIDENAAYIEIVGNCLTLIVTVFVLFIPIFKNFYQKILRSSLPYQLILVNSYFIFFAIVLLFKMNATYIYKNIPLVILATLLLITINICILYYDQKLFIRSQTLSSYEKNLPIYKALIEDIRASQHEYSNRLQSLQFLSESCKTYEELVHALHKYTKSYSRPLHAYPLLLIDMPLLAASLYNLSSSAEKQGIIVSYDVVSQKICSYAPEEQLADFCCILLQNAIEACSPGDDIYVHMESYEGQFFLRFVTPPKNFIPQNKCSNFLKKAGLQNKICKKMIWFRMGRGFIIC